MFICKTGWTGSSSTGALVAANSLQPSETYPRPCVRYAHHYLIPCSRQFQGASHCDSCGNNDILRMLLRAQKSITTCSSPTLTPPCGTAPHLTLSNKHFPISNNPHSSNLYLVEINRMRKIANIIWWDIKILFWAWLFCKQLQIAQTRLDWCFDGMKYVYTGYHIKTLRTNKILLSILHFFNTCSWVSALNFLVLLFQRVSNTCNIWKINRPTYNINFDIETILFLFFNSLILSISFCFNIVKY
jgi:hypothetical protein